MAKTLAVLFVFVAGATVFGITGASAHRVVDHQSHMRTLKGGGGPQCFPGQQCS